jgi:transposase
MSWKDVGTLFGASWDAVYRSVDWVVTWGKDHRSLDGITAIGVDEIARSKGQNYLTLVYQIDQGAKRLLWIGKERTTKTFTGFFDWLGKTRCDQLKFVCSDMWRPYLDVIAERIPHALNILDRFHLVAKLGFAVDQVRRQEIARLRQRGLDAVLAKTRWIWLKKPRNLKRKQRQQRDSLLAMNLRTVRAYLFRLDFEHVWTYRLPTRAGTFLDQWCRRVMRSRLEPLKQVAKSIRNHRNLILNYFKARKAFSSGVVEGLNNKAKLGIRRAYGIKGDNVLETVLFHQLGALPEPQFAHRFVG